MAELGGGGHKKGVSAWKFSIQRKVESGEGRTESGSSKTERKNLGAAMVSKGKESQVFPSRIGESGNNRQQKGGEETKTGEMKSWGFQRGAGRKKLNGRIS